MILADEGRLWQNKWINSRLIGKASIVSFLDSLQSDSGQNYFLFEALLRAKNYAVVGRFFSLTYKDIPYSRVWFSKTPEIKNV